MKVKIKAKDSRPEQIVEMTNKRASLWIKTGEAEKVEDESRTAEREDNDSASD